MGARLGLVVGCLVLTILACGRSDPEKPPEIAGFEGIQNTLLSLTRTDFKVLGVEPQDRVIRVNIHLSPATNDGQEVKRRTLNALHDLQAVLGKELSLAVWTLSPDSADPLGMAYYSSLTEIYHFKSGEELR